MPPIPDNTDTRAANPIAGPAPPLSGDLCCLVSSGLSDCSAAAAAFTARANRGGTVGVGVGVLVGVLVAVRVGATTMSVTVMVSPKAVSPCCMR